MFTLLVAVIAVVSCFAFGLLGAYVADQKGRGKTEGFWLGLLFGPLGVLVVALLPAIRSRPRAQRVTRRDYYDVVLEDDELEDQIVDYLSCPPRP
jgi:hypothetical protein